jgi:hypothetical protein
MIMYIFPLESISYDDLSLTFYPTYSNVDTQGKRMDSRFTRGGTWRYSLLLRKAGRPFFWETCTEKECYNLHSKQLTFLMKSPRCRDSGVSLGKNYYFRNPSHSLLQRGFKETPQQRLRGIKNIIKRGDCLMIYTLTIGKFHLCWKNKCLTSLLRRL